MPNTFNCARRIQDGRGPGSPFAPEGAEFCDSWSQRGTCSYCGSLSPELILKRCAAGDVELTPTDKNYKVYVDNAGGEPLDGIKFYFQHFTREQCIGFIDLLNAQKLRLKTPGYFYVKPFFIA